LNDGKENKSEGNFQIVGNLLKKRTTEEANEEFGKKRENPELKMQTPHGNSGRN
jgi:chaperonin cofactor prefoldin